MKWASELNTIFGFCLASSAIRWSFVDTWDFARSFPVAGSDPLPFDLCVFAIFRSSGFLIRCPASLHWLPEARFAGF